MIKTLNTCLRILDLIRRWKNYFYKILIKEEIFYKLGKFQEPITLVLNKIRKLYNLAPNAIGNITFMDLYKYLIVVSRRKV